MPTSAADFGDPSAWTIAVWLGAVVFGAIASLAILMPPGRLLGALAIDVGVPLVLLIIGWLAIQVIGEIQLRRLYDTPAQRAEALRKGAEAWRARQADAVHQAAAARLESDILHRVSGSTRARHGAANGPDDDALPAGEGKRVDRPAPRRYYEQGQGGVDS
jgi:hypothetical protein